MNRANFYRSVWALLEKIPKGRVSTYKAIAVALGNPNSARAVGNACRHNPGAPRVPCHRVVNSNGMLGGYSGGLSKKIALLGAEGIRVKNNRIVNFSSVLFEF